VSTSLLPAGVVAPRIKARRPPGWSFIVLAALLGLIGGPTVTVFFGALQSSAPGLPDNHFSLDAVIKVYLSGKYLESLLGTLGMAMSVGALAMLFGAIVAWILSRTDLPHRRLFEIGVIVPLFTSPFLGAVAWTLLASPRSGMINVNLQWLLGTDHVFVNVMTLPGLVFVLLLYFVPYAYLLVSSALKNMDPALEEASYMNGRGLTMTALKVTLPIVRPAMAAGFLFVSVIATGVFAVPAVLGLNTSGFRPLAVQVYQSMSVYPSDPPVGAAIGTLMFWFTFAGIYLYRRAVSNTSRYVTVGGRNGRPRLVKLRFWKYPVMVAFWVYIFLAAILPYLTLIVMSLTPYATTDFRKMTFSLESFVSVLTAPDVADALSNTVWLAIITPTVTVIIGLAVAYIVIRQRGWIGAVIDYVATFPIAVPGIVFATGILWLYVRSPLYATLALLIIALVGVYMPHATRFIGSGLSQIDPSLEEAAQMCGASKFRTIRTVTFPLIKPSVLSVWILLFIFASRDVNEAVIISGTNSRPLAVLAWSYVEDGKLNEVAVIGLILTALILVGVLGARYLLGAKLDVGKL
jgi:iron(III) transport system permease protein